MAIEHVVEATTSTTTALAPVAHEAGIHVALAAEKVGEFIGIPITNTLLMSWIVLVILISLAFIVGRNPKMIPGRIQIILEEILTFVKDFVNDNLENEKLSRRYLPLFLTLFLFIATSNLIEFTPGIGSLGFYRGEEFIPLLRSVNTDLNVTLALAMIAFVIIEIAGIMAHGVFKYAGKFITFRGHSIAERLLNFVVGLIELVSELSRLVSYSFRLFGNVFAGEVLLAVATFFVPYLLPVPLMGFELFIGFVQAAVFALLTLFFIKLAVADPHGEH